MNYITEDILYKISLISAFIGLIALIVLLFTSLFYPALNLIFVIIAITSISVFAIFCLVFLIDTIKRK